MSTKRVRSPILCALLVTLASLPAAAAAVYLEAPFDAAISYSGSGPEATGGPWDPAGVTIGTGRISNSSVTTLSAMVDPASGLAGTAKGFHIVDADGGSGILELTADPSLSGPSQTSPFWIHYRFRVDPASVPVTDAFLHFNARDRVGADPLVKVSLGKSSGGQLRYKIYFDGGPNLVGDLAPLDPSDEWRVSILCDPATGQHTHWVWRNGDSTTAGVLGTPHPYFASQTAPIDRLWFQTGWGDTVSFEMDEVAVTDSGPPLVPADLIAVPAATDRINLYWTDRSDDETGFRIARASTPSGPWDEIALADAGTTSYGDGGLTSKTRYYYRILAYNGFGDSAWTDPAEAFTAYRHEPLVDWISVTDFGANGNDDDDDTEAIQAALEALNGDWGATTSQVLYFPNGVYRISDTPPEDGIGLLLERIDMETMLPRQHNGLQLVGETPGQVTLQWVGTDPGEPANPYVLFHNNGNPRCTFRNLVWDGGNVAGQPTKHVVAYDQSSKPDEGWHDTASGHYDSAFQNAYIGLRVGDQHKQNSEITVRRCEFLSNGAGVSVEDWNALNIWLWDCKFDGNDYGVSNFFADGGSGNFRVIRGRFTNSAKSDIQIGNTGDFTVMDSWSAGSKRFLETSLSTASSRFSLIGNEISDYTADDGRALLLKNAGPFLLVDNRISSANPSDHPVFILAPTGVPENYRTHVVAMHNEYTVAEPYAFSGAECCKLLNVDDQVVDPFTVTVPAMPAFADPLDERRIYTATDGENLQAVIDSALSDPEPAVVHLPNGTYTISEGLTIPAAADLLLTGNGKTTKVVWAGEPGGTMLTVDGHQVSGLTVRDLTFHATPHLATAIRVEDMNQDESRVLLNRVVVADPSSASGEAAWVVDRCDRVEVVAFDSGFNGRISTEAGCSPTPVNVGMRVVAGPQPQVGTFVWTGAGAGNEWDFDIVNGPQGVRALVSSFYMEDSARSARVRGPGGAGEVTLHGGKIAVGCREDTNVVSIEDFTGNVAVLNNRIVDQESEGARIEQTGSSSMDLQLVANLVREDPEYDLDAADLTRAVEALSCGAGGSGVPPRIPPCPEPPASVGTMPLDDLNVDAARIDAGLRLLRDYGPPGFYDETGAEATYQINFDNLGITSPQSGIVLVGGIPEGPTSLEATARDAERIDLAWTDNADDEDGIRVERSLDPDTGFEEIATAPADQTSYADVDVTAGTLYHYRVAAYRWRTGSSALSNVASAIPAAPGAVPDGDAFPGAPLSMAKNQTQPVKLALTWAASCSPAATDYAVYRGDIGDWTGYGPATCSTDGATSAIVTATDGNHFFLVVPLSLGVEGSYGLDSTGQPRPRSIDPCVDFQATGACD